MSARTEATSSRQNVPALNEQNVRHLLRRTEVVDRPERVAELLSLPDLAAAVDDVMDVAPNPEPVSYTDVDDAGWLRGVRLQEHWLDQMATAPRPFAERMAFFWHGHIVSSMEKVDFDMIAAQIDLFRRHGLGTASEPGDVVSLIKTASIQPAMVTYLDNEQNRASSPNQNFARELMELFVLGVGNYTEADVEAATAAWTGHAKTWPAQEYAFRAEHHESAPQTFLGRTINEGPPSSAGFETIDVMLGSGYGNAGTVSVGPNAGRSAPQVAAEFLSRKLWQEFGEAESRGVPSGVLASMTAALLESGFRIRPWVRAMLVHEDFYAPAARTGLVRQPVDYMVALLVATGLRAVGMGRSVVPVWTMFEAGQQLLYPPNVSGWKPNGYWVNPSSMTARVSMAERLIWESYRDTYLAEDGYFQFGADPTRRITRLEVESLPADELVTRFIGLCGLNPPESTRRVIVDHLNDPTIARWMRLDALQILLTAPEMHIA